jgi:hypothetical protein
MNNARVIRRLAALIFASIAIFLVIYTWLPARTSLQTDEARVERVEARPNTWFEVELITASGARITCPGRSGWPLLGPSRCPIAEFQRLLGQTVTMLHDGRRPYEVIVGPDKVVDYSASRKSQIIALALAGLMLVLAVLVWRRK